MALKRISFLGNKIYLKQALIASIVEGKSVIHYGCVDDNKELIDAKIAKGYYLHKIISDLSTSCIGVDLNKELIGYLRDKYNINNIVFGNVEDPESFELDKNVLKSYEALIIPDLIEHLNNPGKMLEGIKRYFSPNIKIYIMTPNPSGYLNFAATILRREIYTEYHTFLFTTESMKVLLDRFGIAINKVYPVFVPKERSKFLVVADKIIGRLFTLISPGFADLYMYECYIKQSEVNA
jgi:2-polyprenyl-3-methyl-5-hydroxy-6-metoxy-1,4-benzoquinol methylase